MLYKGLFATNYRLHAGHGRLRRYGVATALELCEADNQVLRIKEELQLLPREMRSHLQHYQGLIQRQEELIDALKLAQTADSNAEAQQLNAMLQVTHAHLRYSSCMGVVVGPWPWKVAHVVCQLYVYILLGYVAILKTHLPRAATLGTFFHVVGSMRMPEHSPHDTHLPCVTSHLCLPVVVLVERC